MLVESRESRESRESGDPSAGRSCNGRGSSKASLRTMRERIASLPLVDAALLALSVGACLALAGGFIG